MLGNGEWRMGAALARKKQKKIRLSVHQRPVPRNLRMELIMTKESSSEGWNISSLLSLCWPGLLMELVFDQELVFQIITVSMIPIPCGSIPAWWSLFRSSPSIGRWSTAPGLSGTKALSSHPPMNYYGITTSKGFLLEALTQQLHHSFCHHYYIRTPS